MNLRISRLALLSLIFAFLFSAAAFAQKSVPSPSQALGFEVGADRQLADYKQISSYLRTLAGASPRVQIESLGQTTLGNDMIMAVISSPENLKQKDRYRQIARQLADPRGLSQQQIEALAREGKTIALVTCNIHSTEIGSSQMAMEWAHALATAQDPETLRRLDNVILLLIPSLNPDGQIMETEWYRKYVGTKFEGGRMPWLYHPYVGHDNNRDWYMLTQKETKNVTRAVYGEWFPQIWLDEHQMGSTGPRIFIPPYADPIAESLNPLIFRGLNMIGTTMTWRLEQQRKSGAIYGWAFDAYWPGGTRNTAWWKNITGLLIEVASARMATPLEVAPTELSGGGKGLSEYGKQINYPNPWRGGVWRLRDIMDYDRIISDAMLETASTYREDYLRGTARMAQDAIAEGKPGEFYQVAIDGRQRDPNAAARLAHLMSEHGVQVFTDITGSYLIPTAQPYGKFVTELFSVQRYPEIRPVAGSGILQPYDVTTWSLPLLMGVTVGKTTLTPTEQATLKAIRASDWPTGGVQGSGAVYVISHQQNDVTRVINLLGKRNAAVSVARTSFSAEGQEFAPGTVLLDASTDVAKLAADHHLKLTALKSKPDVAVSKLRGVRLGLYKPYTSSMDEGWTRWLLEQYGFDVNSIDNKMMKAGSLGAQFDAIILPDADKESIVEGRPRRPEGAMKYIVDLPPEYAGGIGKEGIAALKDFVEKGGTLISIADAGDFVADNFNVPVRNTLAGVRPDDFLCPGSLLRIELDPSHPVAYGMPAESAAFVEGNIAYQTTPPMTDVQRAVIASYPDNAKDVLVSGWIKGAERLERKAAIVSFTTGKGKLVMLGFRPQHRAQTEATFKLLFNAIHWAGME
ncbi:MAG TPA: M14 metallopeptidase family protein [Clostridia bacterium]|nr:M14 metallopeptidase family protein [Clostridia bacterium]